MVLVPPSAFPLYEARDVLLAISATRPDRGCVEG